MRSNVTTPCWVNKWVAILQSGNSKVPVLALLFHPLAMNSFRHWVRLLRASGGVDRGAWPRSAAITAVSPLWAPLRLTERIIYGRRVRETRINPSPVFIVGHWRTGTTLLHYLMNQDPNFGSVSLFQTLLPASFLSARRLLRPVMRHFVPKTRPMDNVELALDLPQEEEYATCNLSECSLYAGWYFPKRMRELFHKHVLFEGASLETVDRWKQVYLDVLRKATLHAGDKPLLLKNPANTARIAQLLEMFPNARFIHIHRDPYAVFRSTQKLHRSVYDMVGLQTVGDGEIQDNVLHIYRELMQHYLDQRGLIPEGNLVELRYEDLEQRPMRELERVYATLRLPGLDGARAKMEAYLAAQESYTKNSHVFTPNDIALVRQEWQFAFDQWGYAHPGE